LSVCKADNDVNSSNLTLRVRLRRAMLEETISTDTNEETYRRGQPIQSDDRDDQLRGLLRLRHQRRLFDAWEPSDVQACTLDCLPMVK
jgi:hypothetical protein